MKVFQAIARLSAGLVEKGRPFIGKSLEQGLHERRAMAVRARFVGITCASAVWWLGVVAVATSCGDSPPAAPPADDASLPPRLCSRPAPGCECTPGTGPVMCNGRGNGVCVQGEMLCQGGVWSRCLNTHDVADGDDEIGGATSALISPLGACSTCNPGCASAADTPTAGDLTPSNSDGIVYDDEGGISLPERSPPYIPTCAESASGLPPGGTYAEFCAGSGPLILNGEDATTGIGAGDENVCTGEIAAQVFQAAICSCETIDDDAAIETVSFSSTGAATDGNEAHVYTNNLYTASRNNIIRGDLRMYGSAGTNAPGGTLTVYRDLWSNTAWSNNNTLDVGQDNGDMYVNGNVFLRFATIGSGTGNLFMPTANTLTLGMGAAPSYGGRVNQPVSFPRPCPCNASELVDIAAFVASTQSANDNSVINLDPDAFNPVPGGGNVELPCGRFYLSGVDSGSQFSITATDRTALFIDGDLKSGAALDLSLEGDEAEIDVFIAGTMEAGASVDFGDSAHPAKVRVYIGTSDDINFSAAGNFYGNFYAPNAKLIFGGAVDVYGSLFARHIDGSSQINVHYDEAVRDLDENCPEPNEGRYWRDYDATTVCGSDSELRPDWGTYTWDADIPVDTTLTFEFQTADTLAALPTATVVSFTVPENATTIDIGDILVAAGVGNNHPYLRVTAVLATEGTDAPLVRSMELAVNCGDGTTGSSDPSAYSCVGSLAPVCSYANPPEICDDGLDTDADGLADCADPECATDDACCNAEICGNFINDDCDGLIDFYDDDCTCAAEDCQDGLDNDADALVDCADTGGCDVGDACNSYMSVCDMAGMCVCPGGNVETSCEDNFDNDCDAFLECGDSDCTGSGSCPPICGDGLKRGAEVCDQGNVVNGDGCSSLCTLESGWTCTAASPSVCTPICGDGLKRGSEACDQGNVVAGDGCSATCTVEANWTCNGASPTVCTPICGNGVRQTPIESCDDGNVVANDGCSATCSSEAGWSCNTASPTVCTSVCQNGYRTGTETCDDANNNNGDGCTKFCVLETGWTCTTAVPNVCTPTCGDGSRLGTETAAGKCDDGNTINGDGCSSTCSAETGWTCTGAGAGSCTPTCGDGMRLGTETAAGRCDDANTTASDGCSSTCNAETGYTCTGAGAGSCTPTCGDGSRVGVETGVTRCDDGNTVAGDGCNASCTKETGYTCTGAGAGSCTPTCGDGMRVGTETGATKCDDANTTASDGCSATCNVEANYTCTGAGAGSCAPTCGDGVRIGTETAVGKCDDGNTTAGDGCSAACAAEAGYTCTGAGGASCTPTCGDGMRVGTETAAGKCDDMNTTNSDGCSSACNVEANYTCTGAGAGSCSPTCGDGVRIGTETLATRCDDANTVAGDGCNASCTKETGYTCTGAGAGSCTPTCGDGMRVGTETAAGKCDDLNTTNSDGCSSTCNVEANYTCTGAGAGSCSPT